MQNGHLIAYASRALTATETRYAQIEKEMLSIVYAVEKFNDCTFGRKATVYSDQKPLESILKKTSSSSTQQTARHDDSSPKV